jgi:hypothetical protein
VSETIKTNHPSITDNSQACGTIKYRLESSDRDGLLTIDSAEPPTELILNPNTGDAIQEYTASLYGNICSLTNPAVCETGTKASIINFEVIACVPNQIITDSVNFVNQEVDWYS